MSNLKKTKKQENKSSFAESKCWPCNHFSNIRKIYKTVLVMVIWYFFYKKRRQCAIINKYILYDII